MKKRYEAFLVKDVDPMFSVVMNIMPYRYDATNTTMIDIDCEGMDEYIRKMKDENKGQYSYMHIFIAALIRCYAMRPRLNRFTMNSRLYECYGITVCFMIKQSLRDESDELLIKHTFCGHETLEQVKDIIDGLIEKTLKARGGGMTDAAVSIGGMPVFLSKILVKCLKFLDRHNRLPRKFYEASPFHCSFFVTNLKSIKTESINHHCYDFGTTGVFFAMGKEKYQPVVNADMQIVPAKIMRLGVSCDERICDGYYYGKSFRLVGQFLKNPDMLHEEYHDAKVDEEIARQEKMRAIEAEKQAKKALKEAKKQKA